MKKAVLIVLLFVLFEVGFADSDCKQKDLDKLQSCYKDVYGKNLSDVMGPFILTEQLSGENLTKEFLQPVCDKKKKLNDCIGADIIKACYNGDDIKKIPYGGGSYSDFFTKYVIASFIEADYICDKVFKFSDSDYACYIKDGPEIEAICGEGDETSCEAMNKTMNCMVDAAYKECGNVVGCFERKNAALAFCYGDKDCHACDGISTTNNLIDGLCDGNEQVVEKIVDKNPEFLRF